MSSLLKDEDILQVKSDKYRLSRTEVAVALIVVVASFLWYGLLITGGIMLFLKVMSL